jgi:hypothetical protein
MLAAPAIPSSYDFVLPYRTKLDPALAVSQLILRDVGVMLDSSGVELMRGPFERISLLERG